MNLLFFSVCGKRQPGEKDDEKTVVKKLIDALILNK